MKGFLKKLKKHWITVWLVAVTVILGAVIAYAVYTEVSSVKRVVTTKAAPKQLFSSNCMYATIFERRMSDSEFIININNYDVNSPDIPNTSDIQYTLTAQLQVKDGDQFIPLSQLQTSNPTKYSEIVTSQTKYYIGKVQDNNSTGTIATPDMIEFTEEDDFIIEFGSSSTYETLPGGTISTDRFKVIIPSSDFEKETPDIYVYVKADAVDSGLDDLQTRLFGSKNVVITALWEGTLAESNTVELDYDFYNYIITGSGNGKLDIMWDPVWFEINSFFFTNLSGVTFENPNDPVETISGGTYNGWNKVTILVDSSEKSRYELQLYKTNPNVSYTGATNDAANHIYCELQHEDPSSNEPEEP